MKNSIYFVLEFYRRLLECLPVILTVSYNVDRKTFNAELSLSGKIASAEGEELEDALTLLIDAAVQGNLFEYHDISTELADKND